MIEQTTIAALALVAFGAWIIGYAMGWRDRGKQPVGRRRGNMIEIDGAIDADDLEALRERFRGELEDVGAGDVEDRVRRFLR